MMTRCLVELPGQRSGCGTEFAGRDLNGVPRRIERAASELSGCDGVLVLACTWRNYSARDLDGLRRLSRRAQLRLVAVPCAGALKPSWVVEALRSGADCVLVLGGHSGLCPLADEALRGSSMFREAARAAGLDPERVKFDWDQGCGDFAERAEAAMSALPD